MEKQVYLTEENRDQKVAQYLKVIHPFGRKRGPEFNLDQAGLLLLDLQRYFFDPESHAYVPSSEAIQEPIRRLVNHFSENNRPVILTRHVDVAGDGSPMAQWWKGRIDADDHLSQLIVDDLADQCIVLVKSSYDAFIGTDLKVVLREAGVRHVVVTGVVTHLCVETTVRSAFTRGFNIYLPADATASISERHHVASLLNLSHGFARITTTDELIGAR